MSYEIFLAPIAQKMLAGITDRRIRQMIQDRIDALANEPDRQGKPLAGELRTYRSVRAAGQRYRIIYQVERERVLVFVVAVGLRQAGSKKDIYALARKLLRLRLAGLT